MSSPFDAIWLAVGPLEGGYSFNPADPGGETMWGITAALARAHGYMGPMRDLQRDTAKAIAHDEWYGPQRLDLIGAVSWPMSAELFDIMFNMGAHKAGTWLQRSLNALAGAHLNVDGAIGATTAGALADFAKSRGAGPASAAVLKCLAGFRAVDYIQQVEARAADHEFIYGWITQRVRQDGLVLQA